MTNSKESLKTGQASGYFIYMYRVDPDQRLLTLSLLVSYWL